MPTRLEIAGRRIGPGEPLFVIAEIGLNHGGSSDRALAMVDAAAGAGASAIKLQTLHADHLVAAECPAPAHVSATSLREFFGRLELDDADYHAIVRRARARGLAVVATPLSLAAVELLAHAGVDAYKIASGDITYHALIDACAQTGRPLVVSTGMAAPAEIDNAIRQARRSGCQELALLHCVSAYPVPHDSQNLRAIATLANGFDVPVGLSDHAASTSAVAIAVTLGASLYERHFVLDDDDDAVDRAVSSTPAELAAIVRVAAQTAAALGHGRKEPLPVEEPNLAPSRRGLRATRQLRAGDLVTKRDLVALRPETGLSPVYASDLIGVRLSRDIEAGASFTDVDLPTHRGHHEAA